MGYLSPILFSSSNSYLSRTHHAVFDLVAVPQNHRHMIGFNLRSRLLKNRLVNLRIESLADFTETLHAVLAQSFFKLAGNGGKGTVFQIAVLTSGINIIDDWKERAHKICHHKFAKLLFFLSTAILEVSELRLQTSKILKSLSCQLFVFVDRILHRGFFGCRSRFFLYYGVLRYTFGFWVAFSGGRLESVFQRVIALLLVGVFSHD
ncbi:Uncharacterised protein [Mycobacteroides abscessus subsp. abscessus]|nr:Uncharacterised protein [Mycobacteroides abscessus subsp. abscessus]